MSPLVARRPVSADRVNTWSAAAAAAAAAARARVQFDTRPGRTGGDSTPRLRQQAARHRAGAIRHVRHTAQRQRRPAGRPRDRRAGPETGGAGPETDVRSRDRHEVQRHAGPETDVRPRDIQRQTGADRAERYRRPRHRMTSGAPDRGYCSSECPTCSQRKPVLFVWKLAFDGSCHSCSQWLIIQNMIE